MLEESSIPSSIAASTARRLWLVDNMPQCPECGDSQIQLIAYMTCPARWSCRQCRHVWQEEPDAS